MNKKIKLILAAGLLTLGMATQACTLAAWDANANVTAGGPAETVASGLKYARYAGTCSMKSDSPNAGTVTNSGLTAAGGPAAEERMIVRFYFLTQGTGTGTLFTAYSDDAATTPVYTVTYDGTSVTVTPANGGTPAIMAVGSTNWHSVEIDWANNGGAMSLWVDTDATDVAAAKNVGASESVVNSIEAVTLGGSSTFTSVIFDDYESRRSSAIGRLLLGDANNSGGITIADAVTIVNELGGAYSIGVPDCNESGGVSIADAICVVNLL